MKSKKMKRRYKKMTVAEIRAAINFGKQTIKDFEEEGKVVPRSVYKRLIALYEQLAEALSLGLE